jgi:hypothetical protein
VLLTKVLSAAAANSEERQGDKQRTDRRQEKQNPEWPQKGTKSAKKGVLELCPFLFTETVTSIFGPL